MTHDLHERDREARPRDAAPPQAPVVVIGRAQRFLDVQPTVQQAEEHLSGEHAEAGLALDACDYYDGIARPLSPVVGDDGTITLELAAGDPQPELVRARVNDLLASAYESHNPAGMHAEDQVEQEELEPLSDTYSFPRFVDELDRRFNGRAGAASGGPRHVGGRLHNFWHAIAG